MSTRADVTGFRLAPMGYLCKQEFGLTSELAYAHERARTYCKSWHTHDRVMLVFPLGAAQVRVTLLGEHTPMCVDSTQVLWIDAHQEHQTDAEGALYDVLALYPSAGMLSRVAQEMGLASPCADRCAVLRDRSPLLCALLEHYIEARVFGQGFTCEAEVTALSWLVLATALRASHPETQAKSRLPAPVATVVAAIDADLGEPWTLAALARHAHASRATLVRQFRAALGTTPMAYVQERRLQEAAALLRSGTSVAETADAVGYASASAFCHAYRRRFGMPPSKAA